MDARHPGGRNPGRLTVASDQSGAGRVHLGVDEARDLAERVTRSIGYDEEDSRIIADHILDAALCGYEYSGLPKLLDVVEHRRAKQPRTPLRTLRETDVSVLLDGGNNNGMLALYHGARAAIDKASNRGIALVGVTNSWMSARSAYFAEMIAREGLISMITVSSAPQVAPVGGTAAVFGTNPIAFGLPARGDPVIFDMGTSAMMATDVSLRERTGELLPDGAAIDKAGNPTRDPASARAGALLPFGGYKGFGLAFIVQALGIAAGGHLGVEKHYGYLVIAFKPDLLVPREDFTRELDALIERVKSTPKQPGVEEIRIPSERSFRERAVRLKEGIEIDARIHEALLCCAERR